MAQLDFSPYIPKPKPYTPPVVQQQPAPQQNIQLQKLNTKDRLKNTAKKTFEFGKGLVTNQLFGAIKDVGETAISLSPTSILNDIFDVKTSVPTPTSRWKSRLDTMKQGSKDREGTVPEKIMTGVSLFADALVLGQLFRVAATPRLKIQNPTKLAGEGKVTAYEITNKKAPTTPQQVAVKNRLDSIKSGMYKLSENKVGQVTRGKGGRIILREYTIEPSILEKLTGQAGKVKTPTTPFQVSRGVIPQQAIGSAVAQPAVGVGPLNLSRVVPQAPNVPVAVGTPQTTQAPTEVQPAIISDPLTQEARKYKSAEEFVKARGTPVYHGSTKEIKGFDSRDGGIYFTKDKIGAKKMAEMQQPMWKKEPVVLNQVVLDYKKPFVANEKNLKKLFKERITDQSDEFYNQRIEDYFDSISEVRRDTHFVIKDRGYDSIIIPKDTAGLDKSIESIVVFDKNQIKTKSQLTDIWNKTQQAQPVNQLVPLGKPSNVTGEQGRLIRSRNTEQQRLNNVLERFQAVSRGDASPWSQKYEVKQPETKVLRTGMKVPMASPTKEAGVILKNYVSKAYPLPDDASLIKYIAEVTDRGAVVTGEFLSAVPTFGRPTRLEQSFISFHRVIERVNPSGEIDREIVRPIDNGLFNADKEQAEIFTKLQELSKGITKKQDKEISRVSENTDLGNVKLNEKQKALERYGRGLYDDFLKRINDARVSIKKPPIPKRKDYFPHIFEFNILEKLYGDHTKIPDQELVALKFAKPNSPAFRFVGRLGAEGYQESYLKALQVYVSSALKTIHLTQPVTNARAHIRYLTSNEPLHRFLTDWVDNGVLGTPTSPDKWIEANIPLAKELMIAGDYLVKKTGAGIILGNFSSLMSNLGGQVQALGFTGHKYYGVGLSRSLQPEWRTFAIENSPIVFGRYKGQIDVGFNPWEKGKETFSTIVGFPFKQIEIENVMVSWLGAFQKYIDVHGLGIKELKTISSEQNSLLPKKGGIEDAIKYADNAALRTQGGYAKNQAPAIFRVKALKPLNQFTLAAQNFYQQLGYDPIMLRSEKGATIRALRLLLYAILVEAAYKKIRGYGLFFDVPFKRRGTPAAWLLASGLYKSISGRLGFDLNKKQIGDREITRGFFTFFPAGGQLYKTIEGYEAIDEGFATNLRGDKTFDILTNGDKIRVLIFGPSAYPSKDRDFIERATKMNDKFEYRRDQILNLLIEKRLEDASIVIHQTAIEMNIPPEMVAESILTSLTSELKNQDDTVAIRKYKTLPNVVKLQLLQEFFGTEESENTGPLSNIFK